MTTHASKKGSEKGVLIKAKKGFSEGFSEALSERVLRHTVTKLVAIRNSCRISGIRQEEV